jgi:hypothetical protein
MTDVVISPRNPGRVARRGSDAGDADRARHGERGAQQ